MHSECLFRFLFGAFLLKRGSKRNEWQACLTGEIWSLNFCCHTDERNNSFMSNTMAVHLHDSFKLSPTVFFRILIDGSLCKSKNKKKTKKLLMQCVNLSVTFLSTNRQISITRPWILLWHFLCVLSGFLLRSGGIYDGKSQRVIDTVLVSFCCLSGLWLTFRLKQGNFTTVDCNLRSWGTLLCPPVPEFSVCVHSTLTAQSSF